MVQGEGDCFLYIVTRLEYVDRCILRFIEVTSGCCGLLHLKNNYTINILTFHIPTWFFFYLFLFHMLYIYICFIFMHYVSKIDLLVCCLIYTLYKYDSLCQNPSNVI